MKNKLVLLLLLVSVLLLNACGQQPLKSRNLIEADQYLRNNISKMSWEEFQKILSKNNEVKYKDFISLRKILSSNERSSYVESDKKFYRFNGDQHLMYMTQWGLKDKIYYLKKVNYIRK